MGGLGHARLRIALLGTRGVPARYGGFETAVEEIGAALAQRGHDVTVYCRDRSASGQDYRGMRRVVLPSVRRKAWETITHTGLGVLHALRHRPDVALVFNAANAPYVAMLRIGGVPAALHIDGHDAERAKWAGFGALYYRFATRWGSAVARAVVVDSRAIGHELSRDHGVHSDYIAYGAGASQMSSTQSAGVVSDYGLTPDGYHLVVARFEPENHVLDIVRGYLASSAQLPLVVVGFAGYPGDYARSIAEAAAGHPQIRLAGAVWDQQLLDALYAQARTYVHGHSVGGTNPSLLRAMAQATPVIAYDCPYNVETTGGAALWFGSEGELGDHLKLAETEPERAALLGEQAGRRAEEHYRWSVVADAYERLALDLARRSPSPRSAPAVEQHGHLTDADSVPSAHAVGHAVDGLVRRGVPRHVDLRATDRVPHGPPG